MSTPDEQDPNARGEDADTEEPADGEGVGSAQDGGIDDDFIEEFAEAFAEEYAAESGAAELIFTSLDAFVTEYLGVIIRRRLTRASQTWCPEWWRHPEAVARLAALWRAFEYLSTDPALGMSTWWLGHADPHLRSLMDPEFGPFALCDAREGHSLRELEGLPMVPSPPELWDDPAFSLDAEDLGTARDDDAEQIVTPTAWLSPGGGAKTKQLGPGTDL